MLQFLPFLLLDAACLACLPLLAAACRCLPLLAAACYYSLLLFECGSLMPSHHKCVYCLSVMHSIIFCLYASPAFVSLLRPIYARLPSLVVCAGALLLCEGSYYARNVAFRQDSMFTVCSESIYNATCHLQLAQADVVGTRHWVGCATLATSQHR